ncbi:MAG: hypothetical protein ACI9J2_000271 [Saprospiraceae bacterium]
MSPSISSRRYSSLALGLDFFISSGDIICAN